MLVFSRLPIAGLVMIKQPEPPMRFTDALTTGQVRLVIKRELGRMVSYKTVERLVESGRLRAYRLTATAKWWIDSASLQQYIQSVRETPPN